MRLTVVDREARNQAQDAVKEVERVECIRRVDRMRQRGDTLVDVTHWKPLVELLFRHRFVRQEILRKIYSIA